jgi:hypothetical protein
VGEMGRYMYAISREVVAPELVSMTGLRDAPLEVVRHGELSAVVSNVDLVEFGEEGLRRNLEDLSWLEEVARKHDEVVHAVAALGPAAPLRLATICMDDDAVRRRLDEWHAALVAVLDRITGRLEWSVKLIAPSPDLGVSGAVESTDPEETGAAYLLRKKQEMQTRSSREAHLVSLADTVHESLTAQAVASKRLPPQDARLTGLTGTMVLNGAYLVDVDSAARFEEMVRSMESLHPDCQISSSGPWPPYSFAMLEG